MFRIPLFKVSMAPWNDVEARLRPVLYSGFVAEGEVVAEFERALSEYYGVSADRVFCVNSCTSGITVALRAAGVGPGTTVVLPPQTCIATAAPIATLGAGIIWADVDPRTGLIDPKSVAQRVRDDTRAVIGVRWAGDCIDAAALRDAIPDQAVLIDDAAQGFGLGAADTSIGVADYVCYSFQAIKHLTTGDGGMVVCLNADNEKVADDLSWFGIDRVAFRKPDGEIDWDADVPRVGFKMHMNNIVAAIGLAQLPVVLRDVVPRHIVNGRMLEDALRKVDEIEIPQRRFGSSFWTLSVLADRRDELVRYLQTHGVQASRMHARLDRYSGLPAAVEHPLPGVAEFASRSVCLPCGWWMDEDDVAEVADLVRVFYS